MFRPKKILFSACVTLLLTFVLAVPGFALNVADNIDYGFIQLNGGDLLQSTGILPPYYASSLDYNTAITSYAIYIPLTSDAQSVSVLVNLMTGAVTSYGTVTISYGTIFGQKYSQIAVIPSNKYSRSAAPQETYKHDGNTSYKIGNIYTIDTSHINVDRNSMYVCIGFSGCDFNLRPKLRVSTGRTSVGTIYWNTALGFTIAANNMTTFSNGVGTNKVTYKADRSTTGTISASNATSPIRLSPLTLDTFSDDVSGVSFTYSRSSNDSQAVAQLQKINGTLDGMAANLKSITDDFKAREDVGGDISGVTSDDQISNGNSGMSTGSSSISSSISSLPSFSSVIAPATGYISFLTSPVQSIFDFGNGYLLYIATVMVLLSVIFWIIKRMGGDS